MKNLIVLLSFFCLSISASTARDFTHSGTNQGFSKDIVSNLAEVGVFVSHKSMTRCALQFLGGALATLQCSYGSPMNGIVKSNPYPMFVTLVNNEIGTCYSPHPRKKRGKVEGRGC